jgi:hypothetical protein
VDASEAGAYHCYRSAVCQVFELAATAAGETASAGPCTPGGVDSTAVLHITQK